MDASKATSLYLGAKYNNAKVGSVIDLDEQMLSVIEKYEQIKIELDSLTEQKRLVENQLKSALNSRIFFILYLQKREDTIIDTLSLYFYYYATENLR